MLDDFGELSSRALWREGVRQEGSRVGRGRRPQRRGRRATRVHSSIACEPTTPDTDTAPKMPAFTASTGPQLNLPSEPQPLDFRQQIMGEDILASETNR